MSVNKDILLKRDGFPNERHSIIPRKVINEALKLPITRDLLPSALGHFPHATGHYVNRPDGLEYDDTILIYCAEGGGWFSVDGHPRRLNQGSALLIPANTPHSYGTTKKRPWSIYWVHFAGKRVKDYLSILEVTRKNPILHLHNMGEVLHHFESLYALLQNGYTSANLVALSTALANFLGQIALHRQIPSVANSTAIDQVQRTIPFMQQHLTSDVTISELAKVAALSVPHYSSMFKKLTGCAPKAYYLQLKMQEASRILETTKAPVKDVATHLGIQDPYYFSRLFKKIMGNPPSTYRQ